MKIKVTANAELTGYISRSAANRPALKVKTLARFKGEAPTITKIEGNKETIKALIESVASSLQIPGCYFTDPTFEIDQCPGDFPVREEWMYYGLNLNR